MPFFQANFETIVPCFRAFPENFIPDIKYKNANLIEFTKDPENGRYGLVESYYEN